MSKIKKLESFFLSEKEKSNLKGGVVPATSLQKNCYIDELCTSSSQPDPPPPPPPPPPPKCNCASCSPMSPSSVNNTIVNYL